MKVIVSFLLLAFLSVAFSLPIDSNSIVERINEPSFNEKILEIQARLESISHETKEWLNRQSGPIDSNSLAERNDEPTFTEKILEIQARLENISHSTNEWLSRQRNRVDDTVVILNRFSISGFGNSVQIVHDIRRNAAAILDAQCTDDDRRTLLTQNLFGNATVMGESIASCAQLVYIDLDRLIKYQFYSYFRALQIQAAAAKSTILLGFELFNPVSQGLNIAMFMEELVEVVERVFMEDLRPEVERQITVVGEHGQLVVAMATTCAYDVAFAFAQVAHSLIAECPNELQ